MDNNKISVTYQENLIPFSIDFVKVQTWTKKFVNVQSKIIYEIITKKIMRYMLSNFNELYIIITYITFTKI